MLARQLSFLQDNNCRRDHTVTSNGSQDLTVLQVLNARVTLKVLAHMKS